MTLDELVVAYVVDMTRQRSRGYHHPWSVQVDQIARALDVEWNALQTAIRKAWADDRLRVEFLRGEDEAHVVYVGERMGMK